MGGFALNFDAASTMSISSSAKGLNLSSTTAINNVKTTVASATTPDIWTGIGGLVDYTGTATATGFAAAPQAGASRRLLCAGAAVFTAGANVLIQGVSSGSDLTAAAGDIVEVTAVTTTQFRLTIARNDGSAVGSISSTLIDAAGDLIIGTAADTAGRLAIGTAYQRLAVNAGATAPTWVSDTQNTVIDTAGDVLVGTASDTVAKAVGVLTSLINGFTYANNGVDATNDIDIAAGGAMDATGARWIKTAALTKQSDVAWAVGTNAGGLDTGAVGNSDYYIWTILRTDTGVTDYLFSLSSTAPTMPAGYDYRRLIGWFKRVAGTVVAFETYETEGGGIEMKWDAPTLDVDLTDTLTTSRRTDAVKVPLNFSTIAHLNVLMGDASSGFQGWVYCPDQTDAAPSTSAAPLANINVQSNGNVTLEMHVRTSSAGLIAARATLATVDAYRVSTMGFTWARR